jgi:hypothetical protein
MATRLIITSAMVLPDTNPDCGNYEVRIADYLSSFYYANRFKNIFDSINIIECVSKNPDDFKGIDIPIHYSGFDNSAGKSMNEINHIWNFLQHDYINDNDIIIKLSGRYILYNTNILSHFNDEIEAVAKDSDDLYEGVSSKGEEYGNEGVHTFLWGFRKHFFRDFFNYSQSRNGEQIEKMVKEFMISRTKTVILKKNQKIGCITCLWTHEPDRQCIPNFVRTYV